VRPDGWTPEYICQCSKSCRLVINPGVYYLEVQRMARLGPVGELLENFAPRIVAAMHWQAFVDGDARCGWQES
jgi:hypothetical protein